MDMGTDRMITAVKPPRIVIEAKVPYLRGLFEERGCMVDYLPAGEITRGAVADADALITRTRTRCDASLLNGSRCRIVATATIGTDHIDLDWCKANGISVVNAPGCNAPAVAQYVMASVISRYGAGNLTGLTIGVIGVGHVGSIVARWAEGLGLNVMLCDPPRAEREGGDKWVSADEIARNSDIITVHTPLTRKPDPYPTYHLIGHDLTTQMRRRPMVINSARGAVTDTDALIEAYDAGIIGSLAIDCWEGEPDIDLRLLRRAYIATPHIAGYSVEGKLRASQAAADAVAAALGLDPVTLPDGRPTDPPVLISADRIRYNPDKDTAEFRAHPERMEYLRDSYILRNEP